LHRDDVAAIDRAGGEGGALGERAIQRPEDLVDAHLLADELAAPGTVTDGSPHDVVVAGVPEGRAIALRDLREDGGDELGVGGALGHGGVLCWSTVSTLNGTARRFTPRRAA